jgi:SH3-like domain-containing protein
MVENTMLETDKRISLRVQAAFLLVGLFSIIMFAPAVQAAERMSVKVGLANVRTKPDAKSEIAWQVTKYHPFLILKKKGDWYECKDFEGERGWLFKKLLVKTATVITLKENCNIRSGPGSKNRILFIVDREVPLKVLKRDGRWIKVEHEDGDQGWIHASLVW